MVAVKKKSLSMSVCTKSCAKFNSTTENSDLHMVVVEDTNDHECI